MELSDLTLERRKFIIQAGSLLGIGIVAAAVPGLITSCQKSENPVNTGVQKEVDITQYPELQNDFGAVKVSFTGQNENMPVLIIRKSAGLFMVITSKCTHQGCEVNVPDPVAKTISCPCHGSKFSEVDGSVINGPASQSLRTITSSFNSLTNILTITF
jgi:cytochrome b6-f complex iron-sulfur subunit